jgi:quinol monooxygenase YgiN
LFLGRKYHIERNKQAFVSKFTIESRQEAIEPTRSRRKEPAMYGLIGKMRAKPGKRDDLLAILLRSIDSMPRLNYVVARDPDDADSIWITEVWDSEVSHKASLALPTVRATIAEAMPMIAGFDSSTPTEPVGGVGLPREDAR